MLFYNIKGNIIQTSVNGSLVNFSVDETNQGSIEHVELMKDDYIELHFNSKTPIYFPIGTYCTYNNKLYYVLDKQKPSVTATGLEYKLKLESYYMKWKNILCMYNKANGGEASWTLAGDITMFGNVIVHILADEGIKYNGSDIIFTVDSTVTSDINTIEFSSVSVIEALNMIAEKFECEWWVTDNVIHFGKCELGTEYVKLEVGEELASNSPSNSDSKFANRIYAFGSDKNIPITYRKHLIFTCDTIGSRNGKTTIFDSTRPIKTTYFSGAPNSSVIVQTSIKFLTGAYAGNTYNVTINPDGVLNGGLIMIDASITPSTTDTYSIPNILPSQVPVSYYTADNDYVKNSVVQNRLALPSSKPYVGIEDLGDVSNLDIDENDDIVPAIVIFDKEYPKLTSTVQSVSVQMINYKDSDGNILDEKYPQYTVVLNQPTNFDKKYVIGTLRCAFQSGLLAGSEYELQFNSGTSFTIVNNSDYGRQLPDLNLLPKVGDTLIMYNYDTQYFLSTSISDAELHLKQTAIDYLKKSLIDPTTYTSKRNVNNDVQLALGTKVNLIDPEHIQSKVIDGVVYGRKSRIYGYEKAIDGSLLTYTVGESTIYSRLNSLESKVDSIEYNGASYQYAGSGNGTNVYLITSNDTTVPSDSNTFSAQRSKKEFLSKTQADRTDYDMTFGKNIEVDGQAILNDVVANTGTFGGLLKAAAATITGALLASTVQATTMTANTFIGDLVGNAASATKLQTPRSIFGQTFDGTSDVTGASYHTTNGYAIYFGSENQHAIGSNLAGNSYIHSGRGFFVSTAGTVNLFINSLGNTGLGTSSPSYKLDVNGNARISNLLSAVNGGIFYGQDTFPTNVGSYVLNYVSPTYGNRILAYDGTNYQKLNIGKLISGTNFQLELNTDGTSKFNGGVIASGVESSMGGLFYGQYGTMPSGLGTYVANYVSDAYGARVLAYDGATYKDLKLGAMPTAGVFGLSLNANGDTRVGYNIGTSNFASHTTGWNVNSQGAADFRNIYADELRVQAFTADISQALAGSDYLTKSVSKLSANFVVPSVNSSVRIIVDDIEGMPATQCFSNNDYIRFRAFNRTSGLTIANVWGTVVLDTSYGSNGFLNGTQAYTFTCTQTSGAGLTVFKGSEVLDYGTSGSGMISRTTLDAMGSPYEQISTWVNDPSNGNNYTVHARLGNLNGIANCSGYGLYTNKAFLTDSVTVGDLTKTNHYLDFSNDALTVKGNIYLSSGYAAVSTFDMSNGISLAVDNIQIGGRNLLRYSGDFSKWGLNSNYSSITNEGYLKYSDNYYSNQYGPNIFLVSNSGYYTISFTCVEATTSDIFYEFRSVNVGGVSNSIVVAGKNVRTAYLEAGEYYGLSLFGTANGSGYVILKNDIMLERSNKPSNWSPAPEDVDASISLKVSKDGVIGAINLTSEAATIQASKINLVGAVTFNSFTTDVQNTINGKADSASHGNFTYIDGNSVYTGTLTANQVNAVGISASSITTGTLSSDRIAANTITGDKINATSVSASIAAVISLDASRITTGTLSADRIAANSLDASKIIANSITSTQINANSVSAAIATVISLDASRITTGTLSADRIDSVNVVANGIAAQTINAQNATFENLNVTSATMYNGTIYNLRSPWAAMPGSFSQATTDNIIVRGPDTGYAIYQLSWQSTDIGRFIRLAETNGLEGSSNQGNVNFYAPDGKYFYINGNKRTSLSLNRQIAELVGIGVNGVFYGWAVINTRDFASTIQYGKPLNILSHGVVTGTSSAATMSYRMFNGGYVGSTQYTMSVSRLSEGLYRIFFPTQWGLGTNYMVIATGYGQVIFGSENNHPSKATIKTIADGYFDVWVSDDSTVNDGSFAFQMFNMNDI